DRGEDAEDHHRPDGDVGVGGGGDDVAGHHQAHEALGDAEVDDVAAQLEALLALEAVAALRTALDHADPAGEELPAAAPGAALGHASPDHAADRRLAR